MPTDPLPTIDHQRCIGCHLCVDVCPTQALTQRNHKAALTYPERCTYCSACEDLCPVDAIALPFMIVFAQLESPSSSKPKSKGVQQ